MNIKKGIMYVLIANIINVLISLFSGFVLPRFLSITTYSDIKLFQLYVTYIGILHFGYADGMYLQHGGKNLKNISKSEVADEYKTYKIFQFIMTILCVIICVLIKNKILIFCSLVILPINIGNYLRNLYSSLGEFKKYSVFTNVNTFLIFLLNVCLLFIIKSDNANVYIIGYILMYMLYWIVLEIENQKYFKTDKAIISFKYFVRDVCSGFFLMLGSFCNVIFTTIDRLFVKHLLGMINFAYYSFAVSIENLMNVFIIPISTTLYNYFCIHKKRDEILKIKKLILVFSVLVIALLFPSKLLVNIFLQKYENSLFVLAILFAAQYISIMVRCVHINLYKAEKKQKRYFITMVLIIILSIILNIAFYCFKSDIEYIAIATLITNIIWFVIGEIDFKKYRLKLLEYIYIFIVLIIFLICCTLNPILGFVIYSLSALILTHIFLKDSLKICYKEFIKLLSKVKFISNTANN